jgi:hypothetical protein
MASESTPMQTSIPDYQAAIERATRDHEQARSRSDFAERVAAEFRASLHKIRAVMGTSPADSELLVRRFQSALASAAQEMFGVVQDEQERLMAAETQLARAHERLRRAEQSANAKPRG